MPTDSQLPAKERVMGHIMSMYNAGTPVLPMDRNLRTASEFQRAGGILTIEQDPTYPHLVSATFPKDWTLEFDGRGNITLLDHGDEAGIIFCEDDEGRTALYGARRK